MRVMGLNPGYLLKSFFTLHAVGSNSLETTYILFELPYLPIHRPFTTSWLSSIGRQLMILTRGTTTTFYTYLRFSTTRFIKCMVTWILTKDPLYWRNRKCSEIVIINTILLLFFNLLPRSSIYLLLSLRGIVVLSYNGKTKFCEWTIFPSFSHTTERNENVFGFSHSEKFRGIREIHHTKVSIL